MTTRTTLEWRLRELMAAQGLFQTTDLLPLLKQRDIHLSREQVYRLVTKPPQRLNVEVLAALCDILDCTAADLLTRRIEAIRKADTGTTGGPGIGELRPVRATIRRPGQ